MKSEGRNRLFLLLAATAAAFTPLRLPLAGEPAAAGAECATCCPQAGPKCVVCAFKCVVLDDSYDTGTGPCPEQQT